MNVNGKLDHPSSQSAVPSSVIWFPPLSSSIKINIGASLSSDFHGLRFLFQDKKGQHDGLGLVMVGRLLLEVIFLVGGTSKGVGNMGQRENLVDVLDLGVTCTMARIIECMTDSVMAAKKHPGGTLAKSNLQRVQSTMVIFTAWRSGAGTVSVEVSFFIIPTVVNAVKSSTSGLGWKPTEVMKSGGGTVSGSAMEVMAESRWTRVRQVFNVMLSSVVSSASDVGGSSVRPAVSFAAGNYVQGPTNGLTAVQSLQVPIIHGLTAVQSLQVPIIHGLTAVQSLQGHEWFCRRKTRSSCNGKKPCWEIADRGILLEGVFSLSHVGVSSAVEGRYLDPGGAEAMAMAKQVVATSQSQEWRLPDWAHHRTISSPITMIADGHRDLNGETVGIPPGSASVMQELISQAGGRWVL
ncbi:hypothetical protein NE237_021449 [Protea cynaroides]|uniref:Uncharacterized protein n=1 Tax=Protea cynaroides TaxID=273540 RepID=A0A9Q0HDB4_9MAGN|nr:hypothetical protein NE237_021449 [Protea cynaroides]